MMSPGQTATAGSVTPPCSFQQEVRFAVVLYGGVSLAVYIHGVTRELYHLARATAPHPDQPNKPNLATEDLSGPERVYRKLGQLLDFDGVRTEEWVVQDRELVAAQGYAPPIRTRFVVDILSGTSAGGINAVFLAKALANDEPLNALSDLWIEEADFQRLINDTGESGQTIKGLLRQRPPAALLNGRWMYLKLLEALRSMSKRGTSVAASPYVNELDLYVTVTDLQGLVLPIRLADREVHEAKHRHAFHFRYEMNASDPDEPLNDFARENDPLLAFAARATSSFPFAFEPITLKEIEPLIGEVDTTYNPSRDEWSTFFDLYPANFRDRAFADGGYLDNKPFSYVTEALERRRAAIPVQRKVLYVEPSPDVFDELDRENQRVRAKPDALSNLIQAGLVLPRKETIREDLERILERNRSIDQVREVVDGGAEAASRARQGGESEGFNAWLRQEGESWRTQDMTEMVEFYGLSFAAYRQLRIEDVLNQLAELACYWMGVRSDSDAGRTVREVLAAWKRESYVRYRKDDQNLENAFLYDYDLSWRLRRLGFLRRQIDLAYRMDDRGKRFLEYALPAEQRDLDPAELRQTLAAVRLAVDELYEELRRHRHSLYSLAWLRKALLHPRRASPEGSPRRQLNEPCGDLASTRLAMCLFGLAGIQDKLIQAAPSTSEGRRERAEEILRSETWATRITDFTDSLREYLKETMRLASVNGRHLFATPNSQSRADAQDLEVGVAILDSVQQAVDGLYEVDPQIRQAVLSFCEFYYHGFEYYDMISFPLLSLSQLGEAVKVDLIRVSPGDAETLSEQMNLPSNKKLAGTLLANFGGFMDDHWRRNDLLWGRLDGAERLIDSLLPNTTEKKVKRIRDQLVREVHEAIVEEELGPLDRKKVASLIVSTLSEATSAGSSKEKKRRLSKKGQVKSASEWDPTALAAALESHMDQKRSYDLFIEGYTLDRTITAEYTARALARSAQVTGALFEGIAERADGFQRTYKRPGLWLRRLGGLLSGLVIVALPGRYSNLLMRHALSLLYVFELFLIVLGALVSAEVARVGLIALFLTVFAHLLVKATEKYLTDRLKFGRVITALLSLVAVCVCGLAIWKAAEIVGAVEGGLLSGILDRIREWRQQPPTNAGG